MHATARSLTWVHTRRNRVTAHDLVLFEPKGAGDQLTGLHEALGVQRLKSLTKIQLILIIAVKKSMVHLCTQFCLLGQIRFKSTRAFWVNQLLDISH
jgi:hypothetical protein